MPAARRAVDRVDRYAYAIIDSYAYGFAQEEATLLIAAEDDLVDVAAAMMDGDFGSAYPHLAELTTEYVLQPGYDFGASFEIGRDLLLDGIGAASTA